MFKVEDEVRTLSVAGSQDFNPEARIYVQWNMKGKIEYISDSHGLCYKVRHPNGYASWYNDEELEPYAHSRRESPKPATESFQQGDKVVVKCISTPAPYNTGTVVGVRYFKTAPNQYYVRCDDNTGLGWYTEEQLEVVPEYIPSVTFTMNYDDLQAAYDMMEECIRADDRGLYSQRYTYVLNRFYELLKNDPRNPF